MGEQDREFCGAQPGGAAALSEVGGLPTPAPQRSLSDPGILALPGTCTRW